MKTKSIKIEGFTDQITPDDKPSLAIFGIENSGKTRFACTAEGPIGYLALDKKAKRTIEKIQEVSDIYIIANEKPFIDDKTAIRLSCLDGEGKKDSPGSIEIMRVYTEVVKRVMDYGQKLASHADIQTIVVDKNNQLFDYILFSHYGRRNKIDPIGRSESNQDMIDFVNSLRSKNLILLHGAADEWKDTGEIGKDGRKLQAPSGKQKAQGFRDIGSFVNAVCEFTIDKAPKIKAEKKYRVKVISCQTNSMLEGRFLDGPEDSDSDYGVCGEKITWANLTAVMGM